MNRSLAALLVGRTLADRYEIEEMIGRGGMSLVYRARDRRLHRPVAVKVISLPSDSDEEHRMLRERLRREAAAAARVPPHPNVVQVYDYGTDLELDLDFIAMELLHGRDLKSMQRDGPLPYGETIRILREAARGLAAGHRAGIVHRDVKPANIIVTGDAPGGTVKLLDFGIAKALEAALDDDLTRTGQVPHSPAYASPEQLRAGEPVTPTSDVYQLGLIAYEMLAGTRARGGVVEEGERWLAVPEPVRQVVQAALRPRAEERYANAAGFAEALSRAVDAEEGTVLLPPPRSAPEPDMTILTPPPVHTTPPAAPVELSTRGRDVPAAGHGRLPRVALGVAAVLLGLVLLWALAGRDEGEPPLSDPALASDIEALDEEFRDLTQEAHANLRELGAELAPP
jgi:serine/threonine protein kinase